MLVFELHFRWSRKWAISIRYTDTISICIDSIDVGLDTRRFRLLATWRVKGQGGCADKKQGGGGWIEGSPWIESTYRRIALQNCRYRYYAVRPAICRFCFYDKSGHRPYALRSSTSDLGVNFNFKASGFWPPSLHIVGVRVCAEHPPTISCVLTFFLCDLASAGDAPQLIPQL